jgi:hypothetical protein
MMSKYKEVQTQFRNIDSLKAALTKLGIQFEGGTTFQSSVKLHTSWRGMYGNVDQDVCIAVQRQDAIKAGMGDFDGFGFRWNGTTFELVQDHLDSGMNHISKKFGTLKAEYANCEVHRQAKMRGYNVSEQRRADGTIALTLVRR